MTEVVLKTPQEALAFAADESRRAARKVHETAPPGRSASGAVTALIEFADALDPPAPRLSQEAEAAAVLFVQTQVSRAAGSAMSLPSCGKASSTFSPAT